MRRPCKTPEVHLDLVWSSSPWPDTAAGRLARSQGKPPDLQPGCEYRVEVRFVPHRRGDPQEVIRPEADLELRLEYLAPPGDGSSQERLVIAPSQPQAVPIDKVSGFGVVYTLKVTVGGDPEDGVLLMTVESGSGHFHSRRIEVVLTGEPGAEIRRSISITFDRATAAHVLNLYAVASPGDQLRVIGFVGFERRHVSQPVDRPNKGLAMLMEAWKESPTMRTFDEFNRLARNVKGELTEFARHLSGKLLGWLVPHLKQDPRPSVMITDHTPYEVPWEMMELAPWDPLGALTPVARWTEVKDFPARIGEFNGQRGDSMEGTRNSLRVLHIEPQDLHGSMLAHIDRQIDAEGHPALRQTIVQHSKDLPDLVARLNRPIEDVCLVYLFCHAAFDEMNFRKSAVDSFWAVRFSEIEPKDQKRPLFFVNACHSARITVEEGRTVGLPESLLARVAGGYIGTLGPVEETLAAEVAADLLSQAFDGILYPAEALRVLRRRAIDDLREDPNDEPRMARFLNTFMYVYFGNPLAGFTLQRNAPPGGGE